LENRMENKIANAFVLYASECPCFEEGFCRAQAIMDADSQYIYGSCMKINCHSYFWANKFAEILIENKL